MKTLYVSDLDGTLLQSDEKLSAFTTHTINQLVEKGILFSYATARSYNTAKKVTQGLNAKVPLIVYNGALIIDNVTGEILLSNFFKEEEKQAVIQDLLDHDIHPIVYAFINGKEKFSYVKAKNNSGMQTFIDSRKGDPRDNPIIQDEDLFKGNCFYITCMDSKGKLEPLYNKYNDLYTVVYQEDIYLHNQWLEIMPKNVSKSQATKQLKEYLGYDKIIAFGDGVNDIDLFMLADQAYAVSNAVDELKQHATKTILSNNEDGVAKWLLENVNV